MDCGRLVCGDCSTRFDAKRLCTEHANAAAIAVREQKVAQERDTERKEADERARQEELENTPLDMTPAQAFDALFITDHDYSRRREVISAKRELRRLDAKTFISLALERFRAKGLQTERFNITGGPARGWLTQMRMVDVYWFRGRYDSGRQWGLTPSGRFVFQSGSGWQSGGGGISSKGYVKWMKPDEVISKLIGGDVPPRPVA